MPNSSTKRTVMAIAALVFLAAAAAGVYLYRLHRSLPGATAGPAPDILSELPPDAPAVAYIDVAALRRLQDSPLAAVLGLTTTGPREDREYAEFVRDTGFDYTRDLDRAAIAFWPASLGPPSNALRQDRALAVADGRFDRQKITAYALRSGGFLTRGTHSIYEVSGNPPVAFEFLSPARIALASGARADHLLAASNSPPRDPVMLELIHRVAGAPIFAAARTDNLPGSFYANFRNAPQLERLVRSVQGLTFSGQPEGDRINLALDAECDSTKGAFQIAAQLDILRLLGSLALADPKTRREMTKEQAVFLEALIRRVKVSRQDRRVRLDLELTPEMLAAASSASARLAPVPRTTR